MTGGQGRCSTAQYDAHLVVSKQPLDSTCLPRTSSTWNRMRSAARPCTSRSSSALHLSSMEQCQDLACMSCKTKCPGTSAR